MMSPSASSVSRACASSFLNPHISRLTSDVWRSGLDTRPNSNSLKSAFPLYATAVVASTLQHHTRVSQPATTPSRPRVIATTSTRSCLNRQVFSCYSMGSIPTHVLPRLPLFEALLRHDPDSTAVIHCLSNRSFKYGELLGDVARARHRLIEAAGKSQGEDLNGERVAFLLESGYDHVGMLPAVDCMA